MAVMAATALLATACGDSPSSGASGGAPNAGGSASSQPVAYTQCMRSHGLPDFPDPTTIDGQPEFVISISRDGFDPHSPQVLAKVRVCERVLPPGVPRPSATVAP